MQKNCKDFTFPPQIAAFPATLNITFKGRTSTQIFICWYLLLPIAECLLVLFISIPSESARKSSEWGTKLLHPETLT